MGIQELLAKNGWSLHVGDPYIMGWIIFGGYIITSVLCLFSGVSKAKLEGYHKNSIFWFGLSIIMLLLGINKQLDLQVLFIVIGRIIAHSQDWFDIRREVQKIFIIGSATSSFIFIAIIFWFFKKQLLKNIFVLVGVILVFSFVLIRAFSINHIVVIPSQINYIGSIQMGYVIETVGILCICYGALHEIITK